MTYMLLLNCALKLIEEIIVSLPVHNKLNINLKTSISLSFMYVIRKSQRLTSN